MGLRSWDEPPFAAGYAVSAMEAAGEQIKSLRARAERAEAERDEWKRASDAQERGFLSACHERDSLREEAERLRRERSEAREIMGDAFNAMSRWAAEEDGIPDGAWQVFSRIAMVLAWPLNHSRGTSPVEAGLVEQLAKSDAENAEMRAALIRYGSAWDGDTTNDECREAAYAARELGRRLREQAKTREGAT